jgi:hypothetical protein
MSRPCSNSLRSYFSAICVIYDIHIGEKQRLEPVSLRDYMVFWRGVREHGTLNWRVTKKQRSDEVLEVTRETKYFCFN